MSEEWITNLKVGDKVVIRGGGFGRDNYRIITVQKVTPQQIHVGDKPDGHLSKFWKKNGEQIGNDVWHRVTLEQPTPELIAKIDSQKRRAKVLNELTKVKWHDLPIETLEKVRAILFPTPNNEQSGD